jgi:hypothetical protein
VLYGYVNAVKPLLTRTWASILTGLNKEILFSNLAVNMSNPGVQYSFE